MLAEGKQLKKKTVIYSVANPISFFFVGGEGEEERRKTHPSHGMFADTASCAVVVAFALTLQLQEAKVEQDPSWQPRNVIKAHLAESIFFPLLFSLPLYTWFINQ